MRGWLAILAAASLVIALAGCRDQAVGAPAVVDHGTDDTRLTVLQADGRRLYEFYCAVCHGPNGGGDGFNAWNLDPRPEPFQGNPLVEGIADEDLAAVIRSGGRSVGKSVLMPPWGRTLSDPQINALVAYLRVLVAPQSSPDEAENGHSSP